ncbi:hypothetical protein L0Z72_13480, partial [candidate division KSB1 bacterium]|nr:hypothetical protein [candidate division KSB1 bacterium]
AKIQYMVCGSVASSIYGEPRATNDIDIIITCSLKQLKQFMASFSEDYYADFEMAEDAFRRKSMFNIIDMKTGLKADLIYLKDDGYALEGFSRRQTNKIFDVEVILISPEDSILSKLKWAKMGQSDRQLRDAFGVAVVQWENLDKDYLKKWAKKLEVEDFLNKILEEAEKLQD